MSFLFRVPAPSGVICNLKLSVVFPNDDRPLPGSVVLAPSRYANRFSFNVLGSSTGAVDQGIEFKFQDLFSTSVRSSEGGTRISTRTVQVLTRRGTRPQGVYINPTYPHQNTEVSSFPALIPIDEGTHQFTIRITRYDGNLSIHNYAHHASLRDLYTLGAQERTATRHQTG